MVRRRIFLVSSLAAAAVCALLLHSCSGSNPSDGADASSAVEGSIADTGAAMDSTTPPDGMFADGTADAPLDDARDASWFDGEYCPSAAWPPRSDGCPCEPERSSLSCREEILGKVCDYFTATCPPGPAARFTCVWKRPKEEPAYLGWDGVAIPCDTKNDAGDGAW